ncbi:MAG: hypothetical protein KF902_11855 [Phycisphaeraceae bacterium]|nr:hypothetical protein [Phycisphaeraceae bacterium]MCW5769415.1 hypothetical protein [Phycisphaeraceae bacterium]
MKAEKSVTSVEVSTPEPYTNAIALKRTLRRLVKTLLDANPAPPSGTMRAAARDWLSGSSGSFPPAVNTWMRRTFTEDTMGSQVVTLTPTNAIAYANALDAMVDAFAQGGQPSDPVMATAWAWVTADASDPTHPVPPEVLEFVDSELPATV